MLCFWLQEGPSVDTSARALSVPPAALLNPDCTGYLMKLSRKWKVWQRRYLVLKHAKIYWFIDAEATSAIGKSLSIILHILQISLLKRVSFLSFLNSEKIGYLSKIHSSLEAPQ